MKDTTEPRQATRTKTPVIDETPWQTTTVDVAIIATAMEEPKLPRWVGD